MDLDKKAEEILQNTIDKDEHQMADYLNGFTEEMVLDAIKLALTIPVVSIELKDKYKPTFEEWWNKQDILETDYNKYVNGYQLKKGETIYQIYERELKTNL